MHANPRDTVSLSAFTSSSRSTRVAAAAATAHASQVIESEREREKAVSTLILLSSSAFFTLPFPLLSIVLHFASCPPDVTLSLPHSLAHSLDRVRSTDLHCSFSPASFTLSRSLSLARGIRHTHSHVSRPAASPARRQHLPHLEWDFTADAAIG